MRFRCRAWFRSSMTPGRQRVGDRSPTSASPLLYVGEAQGQWMKMTEFRMVLSSRHQRSPADSEPCEEKPCGVFSSMEELPNRARCDHCRNSDHDRTGIDSVCFPQRSDRVAQWNKDEEGDIRYE